MMMMVMMVMMVVIMMVMMVMMVVIMMVMMMMKVRHRGISNESQTRAMDPDNNLGASKALEPLST